MSYKINTAFVFALILISSVIASCTMDKAQEYIAEVLNIPSELKVESIIAIGYPEKRKSLHAKKELQYDKIYLNSYGKLY